MKRPTYKRTLFSILTRTVITGLALVTAPLILLCACSTSRTSSADTMLNKPTTEVITNTSTPTTNYPVVSTPETTKPEWQPDQADVEAISKTLWGECRGVPYTSHKAAVVWCILNRVDEGGYFGSSIIEVVSKPNQFAGYDPDYPVDPELEEIARDVLKRWHAEKEGETNVGRVLPSGYCYFVGDGELNYFTNEWRSKNYWDWSLPNPYES